VSPEACLRDELQRLRDIDYVTGDLYAEDVDVLLDLTAIDFPDASFDVILCSHVLEHIPDDRVAMAEIRRVLRPDGWALINGPSDPARTMTYEDAAIVLPEERLRHFGQEDHARVYSSRDFAARLENAGFGVVVDPMEFSPGDRRRYQLDGDVGWDHGYLCRPRTHAGTVRRERDGASCTPRPPPGNT
jgi:SAM-dependent methyltransferase